MTEHIPEWFDRSKVEGPIWADPPTLVTFTCLDHESCKARVAATDGTFHRDCHASVAYNLHLFAAIAEGFCPHHQNCRLSPVPEWGPDGRGVEAKGQCMREDRRRWAIGTDPLTGPWWSWDRDDPRDRGYPFVTSVGPTRP